MERIGYMSTAIQDGISKFLQVKHGSSATLQPGERPGVVISIESSADLQLHSEYVLLEQEFESCSPLELIVRTEEHFW